SSQALTHLRLMLTHDQVTGEMTEQPTTQSLDATFDARGLEIFRQNLKLIKMAATMMGSQLFVIKQPTLIVPDLAPELRKECGYHNHGFDHNAHVKAYQGIYRVIEEEVVAADIIDLTGMSGNKDYFYDHVHPTHPLGVNAITEMVAPVLEDWLRSNSR
ncbi:MAG: hypothetical protein K8I00_05995, partial [Candidatus Omnitrophica bacterium]|nr:hypothetical protein [Candidatus Omnitrophota bacterium]